MQRVHVHLVSGRWGLTFKTVLVIPYVPVCISLFVFSSSSSSMCAQQLSFSSCSWSFHRVEKLRRRQAGTCASVHECVRLNNVIIDHVAQASRTDDPWRIGSNCFAFKLFHFRSQLVWVSLASQSALTASALLCDESPLAIAVTQMAKSLPYQIPASRRLGMQLNLPQ